MPDIYLYVVSIDSIQQQGLSLTPHIQQVLPVLTETIRRLVAGLLYPVAFLV
jgi:hydrogenase maturation protease